MWVASSVISTQIQDTLRKYGVKPIDLGAKPHFNGTSLTFFELYMREAILRSMRDSILADLPTDVLILNFSNTLTHECQTWYAQGPVSTSLRNIRGEMPLRYRLPLSFFDRILTKIDLRMIHKMRNIAGKVVANSFHCRESYKKMGIRVDDVIYAPLDCNSFKTSTSNPSSDYVLTYFGKETKYGTIRLLADAGLKFKAFGGKMLGIFEDMTNHPNIKYLGVVNHDTLVKLYSNALYTLFTFTDEQFGYIPVESMACSTPVLTYNSQGPAEAVVEGETGWLARNDRELMEKAVDLWKTGDYDDGMRKCCRKRVDRFEKSTIAKIWEDTILNSS